MFPVPKQCDVLRGGESGFSPLRAGERIEAARRGSAP